MDTRSISRSQIVWLFLSSFALCFVTFYLAETWWDANTAGLNTHHGAGSGTLRGSETEAYPYSSTSNVANSFHSPSCSPVTILVDENVWGARQHALLFARTKIPDVNQQPEPGFALQSLTAFDGKLHLAYGDSNDNTGPLAMHAWDPVAQVWIYTGMVNSEELRVFRTHDNVLYAPEIDAHGEERRRKSVVYQLQCGEKGNNGLDSPRSHLTTWTVMGTPVIGSAHIYDLIVIPPSNKDETNKNSTIMVSTGSRHNESAVLASTLDYGRTWVDVWRPPVEEDVYSRIYHIGATTDQDLLYIWGVFRRHGTEESFAMVRYANNSTNNETEEFQAITNLEIATPSSDDFPPHLVPVVLGKDMILAAFAHRPPLAPQWGSYRLHGNRIVPIDPWPKIYNSNDTTLVAWTRDANNPHRLLVLVKCCEGVTGVYRTDSLALDEPVFEEAIVLDPLDDDDDDDDEYLSLTLLRNDLYLGTKQGNLYIVREFYKPL